MRYEPTWFRQQSLEMGIRLVQHVLPSLRRNTVKGVARTQLKHRLCGVDEKRVTRSRRTAPKIQQMFDDVQNLELRGHQGFLIGFRFACLPSSYFLESPCHGRAQCRDF